MSFTYNPHINTSIPKSPTVALSDEFSSILASTNNFDFTSYTCSFITTYDNGLSSDWDNFLGFTRETKCSPNSIDVIAHLKLLRAIAAMKRKYYYLVPTLIQLKFGKLLLVMPLDDF